MMKTKKRIISAFLSITIVSTFVLYPLSSKAYPVFDIPTEFATGITAAETSALTFKEFGLDLAARLIARDLLRRYLNRIINRIAGLGRGGNPSFVQDWREFQLLGQFRGETVFRGMVFEAIQGGLICSELAPALQRIFNPRTVLNVDTILQRVNDLQPYSVKTRCTLPSDLPPLDVDFARGGAWETWRRTFSPQNNIAGLILLSFSELEKQREIEQSADLNEAISGSGYISLKTGCKSDPEEISTSSDDIASPPRKTCTILGQTVTPGAWLKEASSENVRAGVNWIVEADEIDEIITAVISAVITRAWSSAGLTSGSPLSEGESVNSVGSKPPPPNIPPPGSGEIPPCTDFFHEDICAGGSGINGGGTEDSGEI